jgi:hypothetical protein
MSTTACSSNSTSTTSPSAFPPDLVSLFQKQQQSVTAEQQQPSPGNDDAGNEEDEDAGSWEEVDEANTNEAGHTKTTSIPAANKISDDNPALPSPHAGLFETIAKLAGIDTGHAVQQEAGEENGTETPVSSAYSG